MQFERKVQGVWGVWKVQGVQRVWGVQKVRGVRTSHLVKLSLPDIYIDHADVSFVRYTHRKRQTKNKVLAPTKTCIMNKGFPNILKFIGACRL